jgi:putative PEP-CTERM system histidine kinase
VLLLLLVILTQTLSTLLALGLAAFVLSRNRKAKQNQWLAFGLASIGVHQAFMLAAVLVVPGNWQFFLYQLAFGTAAIIPPTWLAFSLTFGEHSAGLRFARWRPALIGLTLAVPLAWIAFFTGRVLEPLRLRTTGLVLVGLDSWGKVYFCVYLVGLALVLLQFENLYRYAVRFTRWKVKFLIVGVFLAFACQIVAGSYALLYGIIHPLHPFLGAVAFLAGEAMIAFSLIRHRLLDVDIFVSRYVVYRSLTLALVGGYLFSLGLVAEVLRRLDIRLDVLTGTILAIFGAAALSLLLLSEDVRRRLQTFLHTHFYKHKYDYRVEWMEYTRRLSKATALPDIAAQTVNRILEVMWIQQAAMYTVDESPNQMTLKHQVNYDRLPATLEFSQIVYQGLEGYAKSVPSGAGQGETPDLTAGLARELFGEIVVGCLVPIAALDTLVGLLVIGPEMSGKPFGVDDRDLLMAMGAQAGALLLNAHLSLEASESRELHLLARLSAFVAHDLKNMVSMLSMLVENAKAHMAKPDFQNDAIRTLGEVTAKMRKLLGTLAAPSACTPAEICPISLAPTVEAWMEEIRTQVPSRIRIDTRLGWASEVRVNPEQFRSVIQNLVLNGVEAISEQGTILVETFQENGHAVLVVSDTGRGMGQEFMLKKLFRPFQTTKPRGLGIGLYQCRHIIQSFEGTLVAESEEGKGTRMIIRLPCEHISAQPSAVSQSSGAEG